MSGHSKWSQIKHQKAATDAKRGQLFSKLAREITIAAKSGGVNPDSNARLRAAMERARAAGLPKDNMERAMAHASSGGDAATLEEFLYEAVGRNGVSILIEGITDNKNRSHAEIKQILSRHEAKMANPGSLLWNFEKVGTIEIDFQSNQGKTKEDIESAIVESGARDFKTIDSLWLVETDFTSSNDVRKELEGKTLIVKESGHDYKPKTSMEISQEARDSLEILLNELSDHDDVQGVYTNLDIKP